MTTSLHRTVSSSQGDGGLYVHKHDACVKYWAPGADAGVAVVGGIGAVAKFTCSSKVNKAVLAPDGCVFIADSDNARVVRWAPGAIAGVIVAGGNGKCNALNQLSPLIVA